MRTTLGFWTAVLLLPLLAASAGAAVKTTDITLKSGDEEIKGFLAEPDGKGPFPAVVVIQEWWGLNDWIKENAKRLAEQGYVALAPDLYRGKVTDNPSEASQLLRGLPQDRALRDLKAAATTLAGRDNVRKDRIGAIGWCMGGGLALQLALNDDRITACVICYGRVLSDPGMLKPLNAAVLGIFGQDDRGIPAQGVRDFEQALKKIGKKVEEVHIYPNAGHGFMRPTNGPTTKNPEYRETAANDAWQRIEKFLAKELAGR
jgi:carboxymethylenebutenolidase